MGNGKRRAVKRAMTRDAATAVRSKIEGAQRVMLLPVPVASDQRAVLARARAQQTLDAYGVTPYDVITQSRHRIARFWRVYADSR